MVWRVDYMKIKRKNRISIDIDCNNQLHLLKSYFNMKRLTDKVFVWETNKGFHIQGYFPNRTSQENMMVRHLLCDDIARLDLDDKRLNAGLDDCIETLFVFGKVKDGVESKEEIYDVIRTEQFWGFRVG
jgi:hypothetical protein